MAIKELTQDNFKKEVLESSIPVVIKAYATWCGPCMYMAPVFEEVAKTYQDKLNCLELNVDHARDLAIQFGITSIPTLIFLNKGEVVSKQMGYIDKDELTNAFDQFLKAVSK